MARATCNNTDCERDEPWELRKHPDDYARGVACPTCGSTNVDVEYDEQEPRTPERREASATPATGGGKVAGDLVRVLDPDMPARERAQGAQGILGFIFEGATRYQEYRERKLEEQERRARNVELEPAIEYPDCGECGYQFDGDDIGLNDDRVRCPDCNALYNIRDVEPVDA